MENSFRLRFFFFFFSSLNTLRLYISNQELQAQKKNNAFPHLNCNVNVFVAKNDLLLLSKYNICNGF